MNPMRQTPTVGTTLPRFGSVWDWMHAAVRDEMSNRVLRTRTLRDMTEAERQAICLQLGMPLSRRANL